LKRATKGSAVKLAPEHRHHARYRLCMPVLFRWNDTAGKRIKGDGVSRDISIRGMYVWSETQPPHDAVVGLELFLTGVRANTEPPLRVETEARVMRVEEGRGKNNSGGFALTCEHLNLIDRRSYGS
jgi:PilZ domain